MIYQLYEWRLTRQLQKIPRYLCFMISDDEMRLAPTKLTQVIRWCIEISADFYHSNPGEQTMEEISIHINNPDASATPPYLPDIRSIGNFTRLVIHYAEEVEESGSGLSVIVAIGKSGKEEIIDAIQQMADDRIDPKTVDERLLEHYLTFSHTPDYVIKTGGAHLVDFLIWQSVYSELVFLDLNWSSIRKVDLIRAFRDFQSRKRRYGS